MIAKVLLAVLIFAFAIEGSAWGVLQLVVKDTSAVDIDDSLYIPHAHLCYQLRPGVERETYGDGYLSVNSDGFRGPELSEDPDRVRIVCLGGSTTFTIKTGNETTYPRVLERKLREHYGTDRIEVINAGVGAYTTAESLANLEYRILPLEPDIIVVYHAVNDVHPRVTPNFQPDYSHYRKPFFLYDGPLLKLQQWSGVARLMLRLSARTTHIRHETTHVRFEDIPVDEQNSNFKQTTADAFERNVESMILLAKGHDIDVVLSTFTYSEERLHATPFLDDEAYALGIDQHNDAMVALSASHDLACIDVADRFPSEREDLFVGSVHLTSQGAAIKAEIFAQGMIDSGVVARHLKQSLLDTPE